MGSVIFTTLKVSQNQSHIKLQKVKSFPLKENCGVIELHGFRKDKIFEAHCNNLHIISQITRRYH